jgi:hypothetical protein
MLRLGGTLVRAPRDLTSSRLTLRRSRFWTANVQAALKTHPLVILETGLVEGNAPDVRAVVSSVVYRLLRSVPVGRLLLEGGATASSVLHQCNWSRFQIIAQIETGTVQLRPDQPGQPDLILKPGSYQWPPNLLKALPGVRTVSSAPPSKSTSAQASPIGALPATSAALSYSKRSK